MKKVLLILILALSASTLSAQTRHRGIALGADRDTLKFLIASPFDNWYVNVGGGLQTFFGNEVESSARHTSSMSTASRATDATPSSTSPAYPSMPTATTNTNLSTPTPCPCWDMSPSTGPTSSTATR